MAKKPQKLSVLTGVAAMLAVGLAAFFLIGGTKDNTAEATPGLTTETVAAAAGATVSPTAPPLKIEPK